MTITPEIEKIKNIIIEAVPVEKIYLFGSYTMVRRTTAAIMIFMSWSRTSDLGVSADIFLIPQ